MLVNVVPENVLPVGPLTRAARLASSNRAVTVGDQMLLSAANLLTSLVVVRSAGPAMFGIYSVVLVVVTLVCGAFSTFASGQMTLAISARGHRVRETLLRATVRMQAMAFGVLAVPLVLLWLAEHFGEGAVGLHVPEVLAGSMLVAALTSFELFRRYLYVVERFRFSFGLTCVFVSVHALGTGFVLWRAPSESVVFWVLISLATGYAVAVMSNSLVWQAVLSGKPLHARAMRALSTRYWSQGKFGFSGMALTWVQNQSLSILLLWHVSAATVGFYNLGRLVMMPVTVFNTGLLNGLTPHFRRLAVSGAHDELARACDRQGILSVGILSMYAVGLVGLYCTGLFARFVNYADQVWPFILAWALITGLTTFRSWLSQFFIAFVDFRFLLRVSMVAAAATMVLAGVAVAVEAKALLFATAILAGESVCIAATWHRRRMMLKFRAARGSSRSLHHASLTGRS